MNDTNMNTRPKTIELTVVKGPVEEINQLHAEMNELAETAVQKAIRIGELLTEQKKLCKRGQWLSWLEANVQFHRSLANRYMVIYIGRVKLECRDVSTFEEAYRIIVPKDKPIKKKKQSLQDDIVLQAHGKTLRLEKPLRSWHIAYDPDGSQSIICRTCWYHHSGGKKISLGGAKVSFNSWFYSCECPGSERETREEQA